MTTALDVCEQAYRYLQSGQNEERNKLKGALDPTAQLVEFQYELNGLQAGSSFCVDQEMFYVWSVATATKRATVERAQQGSIAASHLNGAVVSVNPRFSLFSLMAELNNELSSLSSPANGLYNDQVIDIVVVANQSGYELLDPLIQDVVDVRMEEPGPSADWRRLKSWEFVPAPGGVAPNLQGRDPYLTAGLRMRVRYKAIFGQIVLVTDILENVGVPATAVDIPALGIAANLMIPRDMKRSFTESQPDPRRASEVMPGAATAAARAMLLQRQSRIKEEAARLFNSYPVYRR